MGQGPHPGAQWQWHPWALGEVSQSHRLHLASPVTFTLPNETRASFPGMAAVTRMTPHLALHYHCPKTFRTLWLLENKSLQTQSQTLPALFLGNFLAKEAF